MKQPLSIGEERFKEIREKNEYYVDKTLLIQELVDKRGTVNLFTRPRRFGKTLALRMLQAFFEKETLSDGTVVDNRHYFDGLKIMDAGERYTSKMGQYPVIFLSLKSAKQPNFDMAYQVLKNDIQREYERHAYVLRSDALTENDKQRFEQISTGKAEQVAYATSLKFLSYCLQKYHNKNTIVLIDEYDVPLENAYQYGFYQEMIDFIRSLFESVLKTNDALEFGVVTGCLRISRESIFTGLNNPRMISILTNDYVEYFGFTELEVEQMLADYDISDRMEQAKSWYDGYRFGATEIYNPWSILNFVADQSSGEMFCKPYWANTSSNSIVRELIECADDDTKAEIEELMAGKTIEKPVHEDITYDSLHDSQDNLWNFLFFTGYLKNCGMRMEDDILYVKLSIPNKEVSYIYKQYIHTWFEKKMAVLDKSVLIRALETGDCKTAENFLTRELYDCISSFDYAENFYHGFMAGILKGNGAYRVLSNRESGNGRPNLVLKMLPLRERAIILEFKYVKEEKIAVLDAACDAAVKQIQERNYAQEYEEEGYEEILGYGIAFAKKMCKVKKWEKRK